jgi:protoporphyrinogen oxidase
MSKPTTIIGAGLAGLSASYHLDHKECIIFEQKDHAGGHIHSEYLNGFTWDEGPHVSFTKHRYVKELFEQSLEGEYVEFEAFPTNYYKGHWIPHPAQSNLYAVPEPLRTQCLEDFLSTRQGNSESYPVNYQQWLEIAFGKTFTNVFPKAYTIKYWTLPPEMLTTDWVSGRVYFPDVEVVKSGYEKPLETSTHYMTYVRYPKKGGYFSYASTLLKGADIKYNKKVKAIDLDEKKIAFEDGSEHIYERLISTMPVTNFINCTNPPQHIKDEADKLACSELLLINIEVAHTAARKEQWIYVYDEDKYISRINFTELLSPGNSPDGKCGIQAEVYFSKYRPIDKPFEYYADRAVEELIEMGLIESREHVETVHTRWIPFANVIFDHHQKASMNAILDWLSGFGLVRESDDLSPITDWNSKSDEQGPLGDLILAGRFGQWKYYWTDDCVLRGKIIAEKIKVS